MKKQPLKIDSNPVWDFTIEMRGVELALRSPLEIGEDVPEAPIPTQAQLDARFKRWPGLWVWIFRALFGAPRLRREDLPDDGGAAHTRMVVLKMVGEHHREFIEKLTTGECAQIYATYMGLQDGWTDAIGRHATAYAEQRYAHIAPPTPAPVARSSPIGEPLVPGGPLPDMLNPQMNPLVRDNRTGGTGEGTNG